MALKKSQIYSLLWQCCDALSGGMDALQYTDAIKVEWDSAARTIPTLCYLRPLVEW